MRSKKINCLALGPFAATLEENSAALGSHTYAKKGQICLKLEGVDGLITIKLSSKAHQEFKQKIFQAVRIMSASK